MPGIKMRLYSPSVFKTGDPVNVIFEVSNEAKEAVYILKWFTPLEGLRSPCLLITTGKKKITYEGMKVKRGPIRPESFIQVLPGETISRRINLELAYTIPLSAKIKVDFNESEVVLVSAKSFMEGGYLNKNNRERKINFSSTGCAFEVSRKSKLVQTLGSRNLSTPKRKSKKATGGKPKDPAFQGMTEAEKTVVMSAHLGGHGLAAVSLATIANDQQYIKWFGVHTPARFAIAKDVYSKVKDRMELITFTYIKGGTDCDPDTVAYTFDNSDKIYICSLYWALPVTGADSKESTILHEYTHASAATEDYTNNQAQALNLAKTDPDKAIDSACNFEYYSTIL